MDTAQLPSAPGQGEIFKDEKFRAAYALNMCTVSVSQIVEYSDIYILEQEYDAILNNLNLEHMPKDEALLNILTELLNTITFFRIQEIKKKELEKEYQTQMKNAIWKAVPNVTTIIASGSPVAMAFSLATQVGVGYMNYRKEKAKITSENEKQKTQLQIAAIEQFNGLRRELFTTAWRLAAAYEFPDDYRLTERQIAQYNEILMDHNEIRKYLRLEALEDKFRAYPPFWYFYGHAAAYIAGSAGLDEPERAFYIGKAKAHFEEYWIQIKDFNILREDQLAASCALEYVDLLWKDPKPDVEKIKRLLHFAVRMAGNHLDVLQICALSYLQIGAMDKAMALFKILVNEDYNSSVNAKILSRLYVSQYLYAERKDGESALADQARAEYKLLEKTTNAYRLFPMPKIFPEDVALEDKKLDEAFEKRQRNWLLNDYRYAVQECINKYHVQYNKLWPMPPKCRIDEDYYGVSHQAYERRRKDAEWAFGDAGNRNEFVADLEDFLFGKVQYEEREALFLSMRKELVGLSLCKAADDENNLNGKLRSEISKANAYAEGIKNKIKENVFGFRDYEDLLNALSFEKITENFSKILQDSVAAQIKNANKDSLNRLETELASFCARCEIVLPMENCEIDLDAEEARELRQGVFADFVAMLGTMRAPAVMRELQDTITMLYLEEDELIKESKAEQGVRGLVKMAKGSKEAKARFLLAGEEDFEAYFKTTKISYAIKAATIAVLDDCSQADHDILLTLAGAVFVKHNKLKGTIAYSSIILDLQRQRLQLGALKEYSNPNVDIEALYRIMQHLSADIKKAKGDDYE